MKRQEFVNGVAPLYAKRQSRPAEGRVFLPPGLGCQATGMGCDLKSFRLRKTPLYCINPLRNSPHNKEHPNCASDELINKSCFSNASAKLQLGVSSIASDCFSSSENSSVTIGRFATVSYFSDLGCRIFPIMDSITCPLYRLLPKSSQ